MISVRTQSAWAATMAMAPGAGGTRIGIANGEQPVIALFHWQSMQLSLSTAAIEAPEVGATRVKALSGADAP